MSVFRVSCWTAAVLAGWVGVMEVRAQAEPFLGAAQPSSPPITSSSQRFVFRGFAPGDGTLLARWTEQVMGRLEQGIGVPVPFRRYEIVRFSGTAEEPADRGRLIMSQGYVEGLLHQRIVVVNPDQVEEEELVEGLVQVLLNRYLLGIASLHGAGEAGISLPDWLSVGMAQWTSADLQARNVAFLRSEGDVAVGWEMAQILSWMELPGGRTAEKAACGLFVEWLDESVATSVQWVGVLRRLVSGKDLTLPYVANDLVGMGDATMSAELAWQEWRILRSQAPVEPGQLDISAVVALKKALEIRPGEFAVNLPASVPAVLTPRQLIGHRDQEWARALSLAVAAEFRRHQYSAAPELADVYGTYMSVFQRIPKVPSRGVLGLRRSGGVTTQRLEQDLAQAESRLERLEKAVALRGTLMRQSGAEPAQARPPVPVLGGAGEGPSPEEAAMRSERSRYLDQIEAKRRAPESGEEEPSDGP